MIIQKTKVIIKKTKKEEILIKFPLLFYYFIKAKKITIPDKNSYF